jgi:hypothetical protein
MSNLVFTVVLLDALVGSLLTNETSVGKHSRLLSSTQ